MSPNQKSPHHVCPHPSEPNHSKLHNEFFLFLFFEFPITADQSVSGTIMPEIRCRFGFELRDNSLSENFPQFNPPLVKRVDVPDPTLGKDTVFIYSTQLAQCLRGEPITQ